MLGIPISTSATEEAINTDPLVSDSSDKEFFGTDETEKLFADKSRWKKNDVNKKPEINVVMDITLKSLVSIKRSYILKQTSS